MTIQADVEVPADELLTRLKRINALIRRGLAEAERGAGEKSLCAGCGCGCMARSWAGG